MEWTGTRTELPMGLYVLAADGTLCAIGHENSLMPDASLSEGLAEDISALLRAYAANPETPGLRVAVLYEAPEARPWGQLTFSYEDLTLRDLYPVSQHSQDGLTTFQKNNRDKSLYRGMELLIEQRRDTAQNVPVYCPLLFDAGATLAERTAALGRTPTAEEARLHAVDVLNLLAVSPHGYRESSGIHLLIEHLRACLIRKDARHDPQFSVVGEREAAKPVAAPVVAPPSPTPVPGGRSPRETRVTLPDVDRRRLHQTERVDSIERWCKQPEQTVNPSRLYQFWPFAGISEKHLIEIAARCPLYIAPSGTRLLDRGLNDAWNFFLLEGSLLLTPADGNIVHVEAGTDRATHAVAFLKPRKYQIDTRTSVTFFWVHDLLLRAATSL